MRIVPPVGVLNVSVPPDSDNTTFVLVPPTMNVLACNPPVLLLLAILLPAEPELICVVAYTPSSSCTNALPLKFWLAGEVAVGVPTPAPPPSTIDADELNAAGVLVPCLTTLITYTFFSETTAPWTVPSTMIPDP